MIKSSPASTLYDMAPGMETQTFFQAKYPIDDRSYRRMLTDMYRKYASVSQSVKIMK